MNIRNFSLLGSLFLSGLLTLGACGSSGSSSGPGGTTGSLGGAKGTATGGTTGAGGHVGATGGTTGAGGAAPCSALPPCLTFLANCVPSGTCVSQTTGSILTGSETINSCYTNGVKESDVSTFDATTFAFSGTSTYTKGGTVCFSETFSVSGAGGGSGLDAGMGTIKNASGVTVATLSANSDGTATVTCTGGASYVLTDNTCTPGGGSNTTSDCTDGGCQ